MGLDGFWEKWSQFSLRMRPPRGYPRCSRCAYSLEHTGNTKCTPWVKNTHMKLGESSRGEDGVIGMEVMKGGLEKQVF